ncbi:MAG: 2-oxoglutarate dehydrogenase E1 component, partial [Pseudomonadota bacterium]|nr:2-oxoglutarate dehydrogenase E1 component [Pseudomonadota bacterium]
MNNSLKERYESSPLHGDNAAAVESMYEQYVTDPSSVPEGWRRYFDTLSGEGAEVLHTPIRKRLTEAVQANGDSAPTTVVKQGEGVSDEKQAAVSRLIQVYSLRGHQIANLDPLNLHERHVPGVLKL